jgi:hypothetical protein
MKGTVIHGTLRTCDLIPAFLGALRDVAPDHYAGYVVAPFGPIPAHVQDAGDSSDWWDGDDAYALLEELFDILNDHAPEGYYFGAHPGDGSDFGFWRCEEN